MVAMDVVDTLRHQASVASRELDTEGRRERLLNRLRDMYGAQGIEVPDHVLLEGIDALEQQRFSYKPPPAGFATSMARLWVSRSRWGKPVLFLTSLALIFWAIYFYLEVLPEQRLRAELPGQLRGSMALINDLAQEDSARQQAQAQLQLGLNAVKEGQFEAAQSALQSLQTLRSNLQQSYVIRVVSRPDQASGVWRIPDANPNGRNYYLVVEAVDSANRVVAREVVSEETNKAKTVRAWGLRVDEATFQKIAADKQDDGIIQANEVGRKRPGFLLPDYTIATSGGAITQW